MIFYSPWFTLAFLQNRVLWTGLITNSCQSALRIRNLFVILPVLLGLICCLGAKSCLTLWKEWCWSWNSSTLATSCEELTHWKRLWCWEGLRAGGQGDDRGWDGWMASLTQWTSEWTPGVGAGQGGLVWCDSWGRKESDTTEWLNLTSNF